MTQLNIDDFVNAHPVIAGVISISIGILAIIYTIKNPEKKTSALAINWRGYGSGTLFIIMGLVIIFRKIFS